MSEVEHSDASPRSAALVLGGIALLLVLVSLIVAAWMAHRGRLHDAIRPTPIDASAAVPALQANGRSERLRIEARARHRLSAGDGIDGAMRRTVAAGWDAPR